MTQQSVNRVYERMVDRMRLQVKYITLDWSQFAPLSGLNAEPGRHRRAAVLTT